MRWTELVAGAVPPAPRPAVEAPVAIPAPPTMFRTRPAADHPWRKGYKPMRRDVPLWQLVD
jgi:hypothetical protein